jgi:hypothetical protein
MASARWFTAGLKAGRHQIAGMRPSAGGHPGRHSA